MLIHFNDLLAEKTLICLACLSVIAVMFSIIPFLPVLSHLLRVHLMTVSQALVTMEHEALGARVVIWLLSSTF